MLRRELFISADKILLPIDLEKVNYSNDTETILHLTQINDAVRQVCSHVKLEELSPGDTSESDIVRIVKQLRRDNVFINCKIDRQHVDCDELTQFYVRGSHVQDAFNMKLPSEILNGKNAR